MQRTLKAVSKLPKGSDNRDVKREFAGLATRVNKLKYRIKEDRELRSSEMTSEML